MAADLDTAARLRRQRAYAGSWRQALASSPAAFETLASPPPLDEQEEPEFEPQVTEEDAILTLLAEAHVDVENDPVEHTLAVVDASGLHASPQVRFSLAHRAAAGARAALVARETILQTMQEERERVVQMMEKLAVSAGHRVSGLQEQLSVSEREAARAKAARKSDRALCQKYRNELEEERQGHRNELEEERQATEQVLEEEAGHTSEIQREKSELEALHQEEQEELLQQQEDLLEELEV